nr:tRNA (adenosine(37)-N6)-threonylcarbamoyltransferase complex dimerization subunit type 1 TsaB [Deltaproteobacteria bacterium]
MILAIDTVAPVVGVAALRDGRSATRIERVVRGTETRLPTWMREVCAELGGVPSDVTGVAVAVGPGA